MNTKILAWSAWAIVSICYAYQYILRIMPGVIMNDLVSKFQLTSEQFGQFCGIYYIGYTITHIPTGILVDRFGTRIVVVTSLLLMICGVLPMLYCDSWFVLVLGRFLLGLASASVAIAAFSVIKRWFGESAGFILGLFVTVGIFGAIYGGKPVSYFVQAFGMNAVLSAIILAGLVLAALAIFCVPAAQPVRNQQNQWADLCSVFKNKHIISLSILSGLMVGALEGFADAWGIAFFQTVYGFTQQEATIVPSLIFLGMGVGSPLLGYIAQKTNAYYETILFAGIMIFGLFIVMICGFGNVEISAFGINFNFLYLMLFAIGLFSGYQIPTLAKVSLMVDNSKTATATATSNMIIMIFGYVFHTAIGWLVDLYNQGNATYSPKAISIGISPIIFATLIAIVGLTIMVLQSRREINKQLI